MHMYPTLYCNLLVQLDARVDAVFVDRGIKVVTYYTNLCSSKPIFSLLTNAEKAFFFKKTSLLVTTQYVSWSTIKPLCIFTL